MLCIVVTLPTFHAEISWLNCPAPENMLDISVTWLTSHASMSTLNEYLPLNNPDMSVIAETSHSGMSVLHAGPQLAPPEEQQFSPEELAEIHSSTAVLSDSVDWKGSAAVFDVSVARISQKYMPRRIFPLEAHLDLPFRRQSVFVIVCSFPRRFKRSAGRWR
jgi:hypothetical protein